MKGTTMLETLSNSREWVGNKQDEPGASYGARKQESAKKKFYIVGAYVKVTEKFPNGQWKARF